MPADLPAPTARVYFSQRLRLHYVDWGNAGAPTIVLLHGGGDHCRAWDRLARDLHPAYHVLAPDQRGHGESQWTTGGGSALLDYVYDLAVLIEQQQLSPVILIGHSRGGATGLHYAGLYPEHVRRVVAIEGVGRFEQRWGASPPERMAAWLEWVRERVRHRPRPYASIDAAAARLRERNPRFSPEQARHLALYGTYQNEDGSHVWKFDPLTMRSLPRPHGAARRAGAVAANQRPDPPDPRRRERGARPSAGRHPQRLPQRPLGHDRPSGSLGPL